MNTQELISRLAQKRAPLAPTLPTQLSRPLVLALATSLAALTLLWHINPELSSMVRLPAFQAKALWLLALSLLSWQGMRRLARPGYGPGLTFWALAWVWLLMLGLGLAQSLGASPAQQQQLWMGSSWNSCTASIIALALPTLAVSLWALRHQASTRPVWAGAVAGTFAASLSALLYSLHCTETGLGFFALWYGSGIFAASVLGALLGKHYLHW